MAIRDYKDYIRVLLYSYYVTIRAYKDYIRVLLYSHYPAITGWGGAPNALAVRDAWPRSGSRIESSNIGYRA